MKYMLNNAVYMFKYHLKIPPPTHIVMIKNGKILGWSTLHVGNSVWCPAPYIVPSALQGVIPDYRVTSNPWILPGVTPQKIPQINTMPCNYIISYQNSNLKEFSSSFILCLWFRPRMPGFTLASVFRDYFWECMGNIWHVSGRTMVSQIKESILSIVLWC